MRPQARSEKSSSLLVIRQMVPADAPAVLAIQQESAEASAWPETSILECAKCGMAWVAEQDGAVAGFLIGRTMADEFEILNMAVARAHRRRGIGSRLLREALQRARAAGVEKAHLEARTSNEAAISLYMRHGFRQYGRRVGYYQYPLEDALLFSVDINSMRH